MSNSVPLDGTLQVDTPLNFHLLAKPAGAACNLSRKYCFFLSKENLYAERESPLVDEATLDAYILASELRLKPHRRWGDWSAFGYLTSNIQSPRMSPQKHFYQSDGVEAVIAAADGVETLQRQWCPKKIWVTYGFTMLAWPTKQDQPGLSYSNWTACGALTER